jgi:predicted O-methyltransferase YrrM
MAKLLVKGVRYLKCYGELAFGERPRTVEAAIDYCVDRPIMMTQVRSEIVELAKILQGAPPRRSLEIGTAYGGTLFLLCNLSAPDSHIISVDLPGGEFGGGYPSRKIPLFRRFPRNGQQLHLIRGDSHAPETKERVLRNLAGDRLDYLFIDGDHTYAGVKQDFEMYSPLIRSGGIVAFHDIAENPRDTRCEVATFWNEIKPQYPHREIIESPSQGWAGIGVLFIPQGE